MFERNYWGAWMSSSDQKSEGIYVPVIPYDWVSSFGATSTQGVQLTTVKGKIVNSSSYANVEDSNGAIKLQVPVLPSGEYSSFPAVYLSLKSAVTKNDYVYGYTPFKGNAVGLRKGRAKGQSWFYFGRDCLVKVRELTSPSQFQLSKAKIDGEEIPVGNEIFISRGWHFIETESQDKGTQFSSTSIRLFEFFFSEEDEIFDGIPLDIVIVLPQVFLDLKTTYFYPSFLS